MRVGEQGCSIKHGMTHGENFQKPSELNAKQLRLYTSQGENFQNASKLRRKQLHFWTHKL